MRNTFLDASIFVGDTLSDRAIWSDDRCLWTGDAMMPLDGEWQVAHRGFDGDIYSGSAGIAWFLAQLSAATGEEKYRGTAIGGLQHGFTWADGLDQNLGFGSSLFSGALGPAVIAVLAAPLLEEPTLAERGFSLGASALVNAHTNTESDLIGGLAGSIMGALVLHQSDDGSEFLDHGIRLGQLLVERARRTTHGLAWGSAHGDASGEAPLCGLGHGAAGIALALDELAVLSGEDHFADIANGAIGYERAWFDPDQKNWPDLRELTSDGIADQTPAFPAFWCHGAVGVGLARLRRHRLTGDAASLAEAVVAVDTTSRHLELQLTDFGYDYGHNFSLCHGFAGSVELLLEAAASGNEAAGALANRVGEYGVEHVVSPGAEWPCGVNEGGETPGLLLGLAGIGSMYLRLADPQGVAPSWWFGPGTGEPSQVMIANMGIADRPPRLVVQVADSEPEPRAVVDDLLKMEPASRLVRMNKRGRAVVELDETVAPDVVVTRWTSDSRLAYVEQDGVDHHADEGSG